ncbi:MAG: phospho-N-acetylmuramoyl-pentapeptide-transferase [Oscillospiraceae bacterium]|nr:phospho-N-acetylmuramoyl-pentapeptide-transferase [Oscillospiraceae bacterium]
MSNMPVITAVMIAFCITSLTGLWLVPLLRRIKYGQTILEIGPKWHKSKQGTPTMGGIMFVAGISVAVLCGFYMLKMSTGGALYSHSPLDDTRILLGFVMALCYGGVGFVDDYLKVVKKQNEGLSVRQKFIVMFFIGALFLTGLYLAGDTSTIVRIPFLGQLNLGLLYYPLALLGIVFIVNVANLTDGIDGLCTSVTLISALGFMVLSSILRMEGMGMVSGALAGGCLGFLLWNFYPAKVFMGDTGSLFLGGLVVAIAFGLDMPVFLIFMGIIYIIEGLSVVLQVSWFKYTRKITGQGKRLFKMSPIHHHFEMSGFSETKIVVMFSVVQAVACALAAAAALQI